MESASQRLVFLLFVWQELDPYVDQIERRNHSITRGLVIAVLEDHWSECRNQEIIEPFVIIAMGRGGHTQCSGMIPPKRPRILWASRAMTLIYDEEHRCLSANERC